MVVLWQQQQVDLVIDVMLEIHLRFGTLPKEILLIGSGVSFLSPALIGQMSFKIFFQAWGHSQTTWTKFGPFLTTHLPHVDKHGHFFDHLTMSTWTLMGPPPLFNMYLKLQTLIWCWEKLLYTKEQSILSALDGVRPGPVVHKHHSFLRIVLFLA